MARITTHPGEVIREDYLIPLNMSSRALAEALGIPGNRVSDIVRERRGVSADTAIRLAKYFDTTPEFWLGLQAGHDLSLANEQHDYSSVMKRAG